MGFEPTSIEGTISKLPIRDLYHLSTEKPSTFWLLVIHILVLDEMSHQIQVNKKLMLTYATIVFPDELIVKRGDGFDFNTTPLSTEPPDFSDCTDK
jgi:hypothetical protein